MAGGPEAAVERPAAGELVFHFGTMACGKSTLLLQLRHTLASAGIACTTITFGDRTGEATVSSRIGVAAPALAAGPDVELAELLVEPTAHLLVDEAQFASDDQVLELAGFADRDSIDVSCFGLMTDFTGTLFPASRRLVELADRIVRLPVEARCWCGAPARANARLIDGAMVLDGPQRLVGDVEGDAVRYVTLCRKHFLAGDPGAERSP